MSLLCPYEGEDPAFRREGRLPNLVYGDQLRAVWVTRYDFHGIGDIGQIMDHSAKAGFNTIFFQVRGNATAHYESKVEPWSETYNWRSPGFDPLQVAIGEAHTRNLALHAWVNVMPMWRGPAPPPDPNQMFNKHPEWSWYNRHGVRQPLNRGFYVSMNPCIPEARQHIVHVCRDIISRYEIDGLHLDYIRFPNEPPVVRGQEYPRDPRTLELFRADTGLSSPEERPHAWDQWRCDCVTALLKDIRLAAKRIRPQLVLSAAVGADRREALNRFQDLDRWWKERLVDAVVPMNYTGCHKTYRSRVEREWRKSHDRSALPPLSSLSLPRQQRRWNYSKGGGGPKQTVTDPGSPQWRPPPEPAVVMGTSLDCGAVDLQQKQLALSLQRFGHCAVFSFAGLFDPVSASALSLMDPIVAAKRAARRDILVPYLQVLARASSLQHPNNNNNNINNKNNETSSKPRPMNKAFHPLRRTSSSLLHPEESFPYDQLDLYPSTMKSSPRLARDVGRGGGGEGGGGRRELWESVKGGRKVIAPDGELVKLRRRTWRRGILESDREKDLVLERAYWRTKRREGREGRRGWWSRLLSVRATVWSVLSVWRGGRGRVGVRVDGMYMGEGGMANLKGGFSKDK